MDVSLIHYSVPLPGRRTAELHLPADLTRKDVTRLIALLTAIKVLPDEPLPHRTDQPG